MMEVLITTLSEADLKNLIKESIREVMEQTERKPESEDETGGIELAIRITGYARSTVYALVSQRVLPHAKRGKKLWFSKADLVMWIKNGKRKTLEDLKNDARAFLKSN